MGEFQKQGGSLHGRDETFNQFEGNPSHLDKVLGHGHSTQTGGGLTNQHGHGHSNQTEGGLTNQQGINPTHQTGGGHTDLGTHHGDGRLGEVENHSKTGKPSLVDKLNPMKDADGDGKKGFMK